LFDFGYWAKKVQVRVAGVKILCEEDWDSSGNVAFVSRLTHHRLIVTTHTIPKPETALTFTH